MQQHLTQSWVVLNTQKRWTSYYKCLQQGQWSWLSLARAFVRVVIQHLARFVRGQCWVTLAQITRPEKGNNIATALLSRLMPTAGNTRKLRAAQTLIRSVSSLYSGKTLRLLMDSWYMRGRH